MVLPCGGKWFGGKFSATKASHRAAGGRRACTGEGNLQPNLPLKSLRARTNDWVLLSLYLSRDVSFPWIYVSRRTHHVCLFSRDVEGAPSRLGAVNGLSIRFQELSKKCK
jgi:hypothetical protein